MSTVTNKHLLCSYTEYNCFLVPYDNPVVPSNIPRSGGHGSKPDSTARLIGQHKGHKGHPPPLAAQGGAVWGVGLILRIGRAEIVHTKLTYHQVYSPPSPVIPSFFLFNLMKCLS